MHDAGAGLPRLYSTPEVDAVIIEQRRRGLSASTTAEFPSVRTSVKRTRNSAIGQCYRLVQFGKAPKPLHCGNIRHHGRPRGLNSRNTGTRVASTPLEPLFATESTDIAPAADGVAAKVLLDLADGDCRSPIGDVRVPRFGFCAAKRVAALPYFARHGRRAFRPPEPRYSSPLPTNPMEKVDNPVPEPASA
jgi:hypothetical protein